MVRRLVVVGLVAGLVATLAGGARAADPSMTAVRLGDTPAGWSGGGAAAPTPFAGVSAGLPGWLRWALEPQLQVGATTLQPGLGPAERSYQGLAWTVPLASGLLQQHDALSFGFSFGHGFGETAGSGYFDPRTLAPGPTPTTRLGAVIGYQVTPDIGLYLQFNHTASGRAPHDDDIANDLGVRLGLRF